MSNGKNKKGNKYPNSGTKRTSRNTKANKECDKRKKYESEELDNKGRDNDPNWYFLDRNVAEQASSFSFSNFNGVPAPVTFTTLGAQAAASVTNNTSIGNTSILTLYANPSAGDTSSIQTGINLAGLKTYTQLSSMNSKTTQYAPQDVTILILAMGSLISALEHVRRAFGVAFTYNVRNRSLPAQLLNAMGFDADDFLENIAQNRLQFNSWITAINKLPFLDNISYLYKCADMYEKVYLDSDSDMAQVIFTRPFSFWQLNETYNEQGSGLDTIYAPDVTNPAVPGNGEGITDVVIEPATWSSWASVINNMITALFESSTYNYIYADILNVSQKTGAKLLYMDYLLEGYSVIPEYNRTYCLQVHNTIIAGPYCYNGTGGPGGTTKLNDVESNVNSNTIKYVPLVCRQAPGVIINTSFVDFDISNPSLEDKIEATRFVPSLTGIAHYAVPWYRGEFPDHYITMMSMYVPNATATTSDKWLRYDIYDNIVANNTETAATAALSYEYVVLSQIKHAPIIYLYNANAMLAANQIHAFGEINYFTTLDYGWYSRINDLTFQALFSLR